jgi:hypothetical protein
VNSKNETHASWKQRFAHELRIYLVYFVYLALLLGAFAWYRRLILAEYQISSFRYGYAVIEALVLAKFILIGEALGVGERANHRFLIVTVLEKAVLFSLLIVAFSVLERIIEGLIHGNDLGTTFREMIAMGRDEILARGLVMFVALIPLFMVRELGRTLGEGALFSMFFRERAAAPSGRSG